MLKFTAEDFKKYYIRGALLGKGSFGKVFLVTHQISKKPFAIKIIEAFPNFTVDEMETNFKSEIETQIIHRHPNLGKIHFCYKNYLEGDIPQFCMLMEYLEKTLEKEIHERKKDNNFFSNQDMFNLFADTINALSFLQQINVAHRDIKPANIMKSTKGVYKLVDLGEMKQKDSINSTQLSATLKGSPMFMSLELKKYELLGQDNNLQGINFSKCDIFSLGLSLLQAANLLSNSELSNKKLNLINNFQRQIEIVQLCEKVKARYGEMLGNIIQSMLEEDPNNRPYSIQLSQAIQQRAININEVNSVYRESWDDEL